MNNQIFIPGNVPSSKNSKQMITLKNGKKLLISSKTTLEYKKIAGVHYDLGKNTFKKMTAGKSLPLHIEFKFIRNSKILFDFINMAQIVCDMMQEYGWIEDDNYLNLIPSFNPIVTIDKQSPGVIITIL